MRESPWRNADYFEESCDKIAETALQDSPGRGTSVTNRQRIGRQNDPRAAAVRACCAVRRCIAVPAWKIHDFKPRITLMTRIENRPPTAADKSYQ